MLLDSKQLEAVEACADGKKRIVVVTGPAGSGKTTILKQAVASIPEFNSVVAAPTGKAARRITEATGLRAVTVHKLLEYNRPGERNPTTGEPLDPTMPKRGRDNPLPYRFVFVDEYAMVPHELNRNIIDALPRGGSLRCFGDVSQLPPIEPWEMKTTKRSPFEIYCAGENGAATIRLDTIYRQGEGSDILKAASDIRLGKMPKNMRSSGFNVTFSERPIPLIEEYVMDNIDADEPIDFRTIHNQIIVTSRKGWIGTPKLNAILKGLLNPSAMKELRLPRYEWQDKDIVLVGIGDKVVCTQNTYDMRSYFERYEEYLPDGTPVPLSFIICPDTKMMLNGETGIVTEVHTDGSLEIDFGDRTVEIPESYPEYWEKGKKVIDIDPRKNIELAYALTTHKTQGSEYDHVLYAMNRSTFFTQSRQNLYTGVTRARKSVKIITDQNSWQKSLKTTRI